MKILLVQQSDHVYHAYLYLLIQINITHAMNFIQHLNC
jgi:hypothetical protein